MYFPLYTRATRVPPPDFAQKAKSLQGQSIPQISPQKVMAGDWGRGRDLLSLDHVVYHTR